MGLNVSLKKDVYSAGITHNVGKMAEEAGIYSCLWTPEDVCIYCAEDLIEPLTKGLELLESDPERFEKFNASNGWGTYEYFVPFVRNYLKACIMFPEAEVVADR